MPTASPTGGWSLDEGIVDAAQFFERLPAFFPNATLLCVEGTSIAGAVRAVYDAHRSPLANPFARSTVLPLPVRVACTFSANLAAQISMLAHLHANPELLDHVALFENTTCVLRWHDAFANAIELDSGVAEETVRAMAEFFQVSYARET